MRTSLVTGLLLALAAAAAAQQVAPQAAAARSPLAPTSVVTTLVESDSGGTAPATRLPWTKTSALAEGVVFSGWDLGPGALPETGVDDALGFSVNAPGSALSPLSEALAQGEYLSCTLADQAGGALDLSRARLDFSVQRLSWHAPVSYAVFYIVDGFTAGKELFTTTPTSQDGFAVHAWSFYLPAGHASQVGAGGIELRLYAFAAEWGGHDTSLTAFRLVAGLDPVELTLQPGPGGAIVASPAAQWFTPGDVVQVSAAPDPGFRFGGGSGAVAGPGSPRTLVMSADHTGYWGDLEYQHQPPGEAPKHRALTDFATALRAR